jgi:excisionase family DNA binding protein
MTVAQAAEQCECSPRTLRRAIDTGELSAIRLGVGPKSDRIHPDDLEAFWRKARYQPVQIRLPEIGRFVCPPLVDHDTRLEMMLARKKQPRKATKALPKMPTKKSSKKPV